jgi:hypothetical protein
MLGWSDVVTAGMAILMVIIIVLMIAHERRY